MTSCARWPEPEHSRERRSTRGTELCTQGMVDVRGEAFVLSPSHLSHLHCQPTPLSRMDSPAICSALRHPTSKGWGIYGNFLPYLLDCTRPLRHSLSTFKSSPADHQAGLPYTTVPFSVRNGLASASRTERCRFSVPHVSASGPRTGEGCFLYGMWNLDLVASRFSLEVTDRLCLRLHPLLSPYTFSAAS